MSMPDLPYLTAAMPGIGGAIKQHLEDFVVEEIPVYEASGEGTHIYFDVEKRGIPTPEAIGRIAHYMGVNRNDIGFAGLKDAQAVTRQRMSLEHADPEKLAAYRDSQVRVVWTGRHSNKIRLGHLRANRFRIRIRDVDVEVLPRAQGILDALVRRGVPNYFGPQRFGARGDTGTLGEALVRNDLDRFVQLFLGRPAPDDPPDCKAARDAFDSGDYTRSLKRWPRHFRDQRRALSAYKKKQRPGAAVAAIDKHMKRLFVSAFQSEVFNEILARRIATLDRLMVGDIAQKIDTHGMFVVEDLAAEQPRCDRFEISPTGLLPGAKERCALEEPGRIEQEVLAAHDLSLDDIDRVGSLKVPGTRRPLRFAIDEPALTAGTDEHGPYLELTFSCPSGCYATVVLREILKTPGL